MSILLHPFLEHLKNGWFISIFWRLFNWRGRENYGKWNYNMGNSHLTRGLWYVWLNCIIKVSSFQFLLDKKTFTCLKEFLLDVMTDYYPKIEYRYILTIIFFMAQTRKFLHHPQVIFGITIWALVVEVRHSTQLLMVT